MHLQSRSRLKRKMAKVKALKQSMEDQHEAKANPNYAQYAGTSTNSDYLDRDKGKPASSSSSSSSSSSPSNSNSEDSSGSSENQGGEVK